MTKDEASLRQTAGRVAGRSEMRDVRLFKSEVVSHRMPDAEGGLRYVLEVHPRGQLEPEADLFAIEATYVLKFYDVPLSDKEDHESEDDPFAMISCTFAALYDILREGMGEVTEEEISAFAETTGAFALYPYAREYVQSTTARMGLPTLTLGLYKVPGDDDANPAPDSR